MDLQIFQSYSKGFRIFLHHTLSTPLAFFVQTAGSLVSQWLSMPCLYHLHVSLDTWNAHHLQRCVDTYIHAGHFSGDSLHRSYLHDSCCKAPPPFHKCLSILVSNVKTPFLDTCWDLIGLDSDPRRVWAFKMIYFDTEMYVIWVFHFNCAVHPQIQLKQTTAWSKLHNELASKYVDCFCWTQLPNYSGNFCLFGLRRNFQMCTIVTSLLKVLTSSSAGLLSTPMLQDSSVKDPSMKLL